MDQPTSTSPGSEGVPGDRPVPEGLRFHGVETIEPGGYVVERHFYPRVPNARLHPLVRYFLSLGNRRIAQRYAHLHPEVQEEAVHQALSHTPKYLRWAGADLFHATTANGTRRNVVIEVNSCPSGQKSMPLLREDEEQAGYRRLLETSFLPMLRRRSLPEGAVAVIWDKNRMEATGYAHVLADLVGSAVLLIHVPADHPDPVLRCSEDKVLEARLPDGQWTPLRAAFRYVTQRPWSRIPPLTKTGVYNPVLACLAGGRNKMVAAKAYDWYNADLSPTGLAITVPETIWDVGLEEVPLWVSRMGGVAVVKDPYSNAGQGVYTITSDEDLDTFLNHEHRYDRFIVQALIGNSKWSSQSTQGRLYHVGTVPNRHGEIYASDIRFMVAASPGGFFPVALYARRARTPLASSLEPGTNSWDMLGTNLSVRQADGSWGTEPERLLLVDDRDFNRLGIGLDDLTEAYLQTVLAVTAIDEFAQKLVTKRNGFRSRLFRSINPDDAFLRDILL